MGLPTAAAVGATGMRLTGQSQTGAVLLVSNLNEQVYSRYRRNINFIITCKKEDLETCIASGGFSGNDVIKISKLYLEIRSLSVLCEKYSKIYHSHKPFWICLC